MISVLPTQIPLSSWSCRRLYGGTDLFWPCIVLGLTVGASTQADVFLTAKSIGIFILGACSFMVATAGGVLFAKLMNVLSRDKINPLLGAAGVSAVPDSARVVQMVGNAEDPTNYLLMHAMAPNVAGVIGSAIAAGVLWSFVG